MFASRILRVGGLCTRTCSKSTVCAMNTAVKSSKEFKEVEIKVPWGKIAGKLWGSENEQPILAIHGWQDNAGSFDALAPLLLRNASVLAIDLPGHGLSSWISPGVLYHEFLYVMTIERLKKYFGWDKVKILAHSLGAMTSFCYATLFPEHTQFVIALDSLKFMTMSMKDYSAKFAESSAMLLKLEETNTPPYSYTEEEIIDRWQSASISFTMSESTCRTLLLRGATRQENGKYVLNRDPKLKSLYTFSMYTHEHSREAAQLITCPYLVVKSKDTWFFDKKENFFDIIDVMRLKNKNVFYEEVSGPHHAHMTNSKEVANVVNPFLEKFNV